MKKLLLGNHPWTSIIGLVIGSLTYLQQLLESGQNNGWTIAIAVAIYLLGRLASDASSSSTATSTVPSESNDETKS